MELARLASNTNNKQASNNQLCRALSGPQSKGVSKSKKTCYHAIRDGFPQLSQEPLFFRSDPHVVENGDLLGFWPVLGRGHLEKFRARAENRKTQFPSARGREIEEKNYHAVWDDFPQLFYIVLFARPDTQGAGNREILVFKALLPFGT